MTWGFVIALYLFLAGAGAGAFLFGTLCESLRPADAYRPLVRVGTLIAGPLVAIGTLFLVFDLGWVRAGLFEPWRILYLYTQPGSMITIGTWVLTLFIPVSILYGLSRHGRLPDRNGWASRLRWPGIVLAVATAVYTGVLLGVVKAVPLWNSAVLPVLFLVSAFSTGWAVTVLVGLVSDPGNGHGLERLRPFHNGLLLFELFLVFSLLLVGASAGGAAQASVQRLLAGDLSGLFWYGVVLAGLALPLGLHVIPLYSPAAATIDGSQPQVRGERHRGLELANAVLVLGGGLALRYAVLAAAVWVSLF